MIKKLIIINGTMGVGKSTVCENIYKNLNNCAWLDGDWCAMINPFIISSENKNIVISNISHILNNFLQSSSIEYVIFNWLIESEDIKDLILNNINSKNFKLYRITLTCSIEELIKRIGRDVLAGKRSRETINKSLERTSLYEKMDTYKIDTSNLNINEITNKIMNIIKND